MAAAVGSEAVGLRGVVESRDARNKEKNKSHIARKAWSTRKSESCEKWQCSLSDGIGGDQNDASTGTLRAISGLTAGGLRTPWLAGSLTPDYVILFPRQCMEDIEKVKVAHEEGVHRSPLMLQN